MASRVFAFLWALAAAVAIPMALARHPIGSWWPPAVAMIAAVAVILMPLKPAVRLALGLFLGVTIRLVAAHELAGLPLSADPFYYEQLAASLIAGQRLAVDITTYGHDLRALYPPVYPLLLAGFHLLGLPAIVLNILVDLWAAACIYLLSRRSDRAAVIYFLFPGVLLNSLLPLKEGLAIALLLTNMLLLKRPFAYGVTSGLLALVQPAWAPIPVIAFLLNKATSGDILKAASGGLCVMVPWWFRNWVLFGAFIPLTTSMGLSLAYAANGGHTPTTWMPFDEPGRSAEAARLAIEIILSDPLRYAVMTFKQLVWSFLFDNAAIDQLATMRQDWVGAANVAAQLAWIALIAGAGWRLCWSRPVILFACAAVASILLFGMWFEFSPRHRAYAVPLLILVALSRHRLDHRKVEHQRLGQCPPGMVAQLDPA